MEKVLFRKVRVIDGQSRHNGQVCDVLVDNAIIQEVGEGGSLQAADCTRVEGGCLSPGWVDMRVNLTDPGFEWKDDLESLAAAALVGGFSRIATLPNTSPVIDNSGLLKSLKLRSASLSVHVLPYGALSVGAAGKDMAELYDMHQAGAVAFSDGNQPIASSGLLLRALQYLKPFDGLVCSLPLDRSLSPASEIGESPVSVQMGMPGIPAIAEEMMVARDLKLLGYFPHRLHIGPVTTAESLNLLRVAKAQFPELSVETSALYLLLDDTSNLEFDANTKVFPPLRDRAAVIALREAVKDGLIDVISSSHHPQSIEEKNHDFSAAAPGAETLEIAFSAAHTALAQAGIPLTRLIACLTAGPRRILRQEPVCVDQGQLAELTHFDPAVRWTPSLAHIRSKSKNNPLLGQELLGKPLHVYVRGKLHHSH
ncbi:MAG TPA: dihydroorotase [Bacteroidetes bacterium]|nr:dihydroorotase [Bacteroidota bacterium]